MNAIHTCGIVTNDYDKALEKLEDIINSRDDVKWKTKSTHQLSVVFENGEKWHWIRPIDGARGYRLHKALIDRSVTFEELNTTINHMCYGYCESIEWI